MRSSQTVRPGLEAMKDPMLSALTRDLCERLRLWASHRHPELDPDEQLRELAHGGQLQIIREEHSGKVRGLLAELVKVDAIFQGEPLVSFEILWHGTRVVSITWKGLGRFNWRDDEGTRRERGDGKPSPLEVWRAGKLGEDAPN